VGHDSHQSFGSFAAHLSTSRLVMISITWGRPNDLGEPAVPIRLAAMLRSICRPRSYEELPSPERLRQERARVTCAAQCLWT
jgi:hypothetical protein